MPGFSAAAAATGADFLAGLYRASLRPTFHSAPKHTGFWLYPSNLCLFFFSFEREKSIEIDLKMSNLINCQLSQQDRYFIGYCRCLISPRPFSWLQGVTNQPTNFLMGPIREGGGVTKWPTGSATGFLLFILFNLALVLMAVWLWGKLLTSLNFISPFRRKHNGWTL